MSTYSKFKSYIYVYLYGYPRMYCIPMFANIHVYNTFESQTFWGSIGLYLNYPVNSASALLTVKCLFRRNELRLNAVTCELRRSIGSPRFAFRCNTPTQTVTENGTLKVKSDRPKAPSKNNACPSVVSMCTN